MDINVYRKKFEGTFHLNSRRIPGGWMCRWDVKFGWDVNFDAADPLTSASDAGSPGSEIGIRTSVITGCQQDQRTRGQTLESVGRQQKRQPIRNPEGHGHERERERPLL